jgi:hypothetical protein
MFWHVVDVGADPLAPLAVLSLANLGHHISDLAPMLISTSKLPLETL